MAENSVNHSQYTITLDDDAAVSRIIERMTGIQSLPFTNPDKLMAQASSYQPTAVFVDIHLGANQSGLEYLAGMRRIWPFVPIFVITGTFVGDAIGIALASGANDFIRKPLIREEVVARLTVRLSEMREKQDGDRIVIGNLVFCRRLASVTVGETIAHMAPLEAELFLYLSRNLGTTMQKTALRQYLWGDIKTCDNALDKKISNIRKVLRDVGADAEIVTAYGGKVMLKAG
jgi:DNA-binding response OmpR family regulator